MWGGGTPAYGGGIGAIPATAEPRDGVGGTEPGWSILQPALLGGFPPLLLLFCFFLPPPPPPPPSFCFFPCVIKELFVAPGTFQRFHSTEGGGWLVGGGCTEGGVPRGSPDLCNPPPGVGTRGGRGSELRGLGGIGGQRPQCGSVGPLPPSAARSRCGDIPPGLRGKNCPPKRDPIAAEPHSSFCPLILKPRRKSPSAFSFFSL